MIELPNPRSEGFVELLSVVKEPVEVDVPLVAVRQMAVGSQFDSAPHISAPGFFRFDPSERVADLGFNLAPGGFEFVVGIRIVFDNQRHNQLEEETRVKAVCINCWQYNTRPSLLTELLIQLGYPAPRKGIPVDELLSKLREWLDKNRGVAVALDEVDQLDAKTQVLYDLQLVNEEATNPLGLVLVSNRPPSRIELDPRSRSRLSCHPLQFTSYTKDQLQEILEQRVEQAFRPGAVADGVVEQIAEAVAADNGDCRQAI